MEYRDRGRSNEKKKAEKRRQTAHINEFITQSVAFVNNYEQYIDNITPKHTFPKALQKRGSILKKSSSLPAGDDVLGLPPVRGLTGLFAALYCMYSRFRWLMAASLWSRRRSCSLSLRCEGR